MRKEKIGGHTFEFYDSIEQLPVARFHSYSKYVLVAGGIGDSIEDIDSHIGKIIEYMSVDQKKAQRELMNLRQNMYAVLTEQDMRHKGFLHLVYAVDGKKWEDFSESGIDRLYALANKEREDKMRKVESEVIGKIDEELEIYFPSIFNAPESRNEVELMRKRALLQLDTIINGANHDEEIEELRKQIIRMQTPLVFEGKDSEEIKFDKQFEDMCLSMSKEFGVIAKGFSVMEFYSAHENLVKRSESIKKQSKK